MVLRGITIQHSLCRRVVCKPTGLEQQEVLRGFICNQERFHLNLTKYLFYLCYLSMLCCNSPVVLAIEIDLIYLLVPDQVVSLPKPDQASDEQWDSEQWEGRDVELKASVLFVVKYCHSPVYFSHFLPYFFFSHLFWKVFFGRLLTIRRLKACRLYTRPYCLGICCLLVEVGCCQGNAQPVSFKGGLDDLSAAYRSVINTFAYVTSNLGCFTRQRSQEIKPSLLFLVKHRQQ